MISIELKEAEDRKGNRKTFVPFTSDASTFDFRSSSSWPFIWNIVTNKRWQKSDNATDWMDELYELLICVLSQRYQFEDDTWMVWLTETGEESRRVEQRRLQYPQEIRIRHDLPMKFSIIQKKNKQTKQTNKWRIFCQWSNRTLFTLLSPRPCVSMEKEYELNHPSGTSGI